MSTELSELFARDPLLHSEQDLDVIVARMRENQVQHELGVKPAPVAKPRKTTKTQELLKDLGLGGTPDLLKDLGLK